VLQWTNTQLETLKLDEAQMICPRYKEATGESTSPRMWDTITPGSLGEKRGIFFFVKPQWHTERVLGEMGGASPSATMQEDL